MVGLARISPKEDVLATAPQLRVFWDLQLRHQTQDQCLSAWAGQELAELYCPASQLAAQYKVGLHVTRLCLRCSCQCHRQQESWWTMAVPILQITACIIEDIASACASTLVTC